MFFRRSQANRQEVAQGMRDAYFDIVRPKEEVSYFIRTMKYSTPYHVAKFPDPEVIANLSKGSIPTYSPTRIVNEPKEHVEYHLVKRTVTLNRILSTGGMREVSDDCVTDHVFDEEEMEKYRLTGINDLKEFVSRMGMNLVPEP